MSIPDSIDGIQVLWQVDNIDVHATLTRPIGMGPFPAVAMVAGSDPTDRMAAAEAITTYNAEGAVLDPQVIETIVAWLNDPHFQRGAHQII